MDDGVNLARRNDEVLRLPPGFRFHPTDEELVVQYLKPKVLSYPLPAAIIPEADVCKCDPWDLPGGREQERYFFGTKEVKYPNGNRSNRATESGYWKATGLDRPVVSGRSGQIVGMKKTLVFYKGKPPKRSRTDWIMHEYRLNTPNNAAAPAQGKNWVLCRVLLKKRGNKTGEDEITGSIINESRDGSPPALPIFYDFLAKERRTYLNRAPANSGPLASGITEISNKDESEDNEESSYYPGTRMNLRITKKAAIILSLKQK